MKIADLAPILLTRMEVLDKNNAPTGVYFTGHTPVSPEFEAANRKYFPTPKTTSLYVSKKGDNRLEIANDPTAHGKGIKRLAEITVNIEGMDEYDDGSMTILEIFQHPQMVKAVQQWEEHLNDEGKHSAPPADHAKSGAKRSAG